MNAGLIPVDDLHSEKKMKIEKKLMIRKVEVEEK